MQLKLVNRKGKLLKQLDVASDANVEDLSRVIYKACAYPSHSVNTIAADYTFAVPKWDINRQRLTYGDKNAVLERGLSLKSYGIKDGDTVVFKDLGPQLGWSTVFLIEYLGPLLIHPLVYYNQKLIYGKEAPKTTIQFLTLVMVVVHFLKREYETLFIHRFSNATMPFRNLPKNCFHYWILSGVILALVIYRPGFEVGLLGGVTSDTFVYPLLGFFIYAEVSNFITHQILSNLRPPGSRVRKIPHGYGFDYCTCPNYFYECLAWLAVAVLTGSIAAWGFLAVSFGQMYLWAVKKHKRYIEEFGDKYPKNRTKIIPFLL
ncbi:3-oxo-5a-steroid 4- dehydrogenase [Irineochytrium annulatum]|nr:3-oxo-5a-steroid 4- dehydrogenase [Irineochytrium annulatum]